MPIPRKTRLTSTTRSGEQNTAPRDQTSPRKKKTSKKQDPPEPKQEKNFIAGKHNEYSSLLISDMPTPRKTPDFDLGNGYAIDSITGIKYKKLGGGDLNEKISKLGEGATPEEIATLVSDKDFDVNDLNKEAETYLAHLRGERK